MTRLLRLLALVLAVGAPSASEASGVAVAEGAGTTAQSYAYDLSLGASTHSADTHTVASASRSGRWRSPGVGCLVSGCCVATKVGGRSAELDAKALGRPDLIGRAGRGPDVREVEGDAADVYSRLAHGADDAAHPTYRGPRTRLDDGTVIGLRQSRKPGPTLDVNPASGPAYRIHFK